MGKKSRNKGAGYERKISKILSEWSGFELRRTPLSGGWARSNPYVSGDVVSITDTEDFPLHIECKNNESWRWEKIMKNSCADIDSWWEQAVTTCPSGRIPLLVFTKNYHGDYIMLASVFPLDLFETYVYYKGRVVLRLEEFLTCFTYTEFMEIIKDVPSEALIR